MGKISFIISLSYYIILFAREQIILILEKEFDIETGTTNLYLGLFKSRVRIPRFNSYKCILLPRTTDKQGKDTI